MSKIAPLRSSQAPSFVDIAIIGAGAAGLMSAIFAGRTARVQNLPLQIAAFDGAPKLGAKILVAGGGRCNVTHDEVDSSVYAGSSRAAIGKVLRRFDVSQTVTFFREIGVDLKRESTGKLFPTTDSARSVLDAMLQAADDAAIELINPFRIATLEQNADGFCLNGTIRARRVILATGGRSLPKSGSDGIGYTLAQDMGHTVTNAIFPALVPLILPGDHFLRTLSGIAVDTTVEVRAGSGKRLIAFTDSTLCTHFGLSGPSILDASRYYTAAKQDDLNAGLFIHWLPKITPERFDAELQALGRATPLRWLSAHLPERLARALCDAAAIPPETTGSTLSRDARKRLVQTVTALPIPIMGDRGYTYAEVTAGGIPLSELVLERMESRVCPGLYLCGEICDVDGRIGGYNFQWAWSSGYLAGVSAAQSLINV